MSFIRSTGHRVASSLGHRLDGRPKYRKRREMKQVIRQGYRTHRRKKRF